MSDLEGQYFNRILALEAERDRLKARVERLRKALENIVKDMPTEEPERGEWTGNSDDDYDSGFSRGEYFKQKIANEALKADEVAG